MVLQFCQLVKILVFDSPWEVDPGGIPEEAISSIKH